LIQIENKVAIAGLHDKGMFVIMLKFAISPHIFLFCIQNIKWLLLLTWHICLLLHKKKSHCALFDRFHHLFILVWGKKWIVSVDARKLMVLERYTLYT